MTTTLTPDQPSPPKSIPRRLFDEITPLEWIVYGVIAAVMLVLVLLEPEILEAPVENTNTIVFTLGGTVLAAIALVVMLWFRVPAIIRLVVLVVPFVIVNWWLISPFFIDDVVEEEFDTSIAAALAEEGASDAAPTDPASDPAEGASEDDSPPVDDATEPPPASDPPAAAPTEPVLLGAGSFVGLAGHSGTGDAGFFRQPDESLVLRLENFDIQNGPDLEVYVVPGADQTSLADGSIHLGALKGNIGNQTYDLPPGTALESGPYTVLVWCEAFSVEFVGATVVV